MPTEGLQLMKCRESSAFTCKPFKPLMRVLCGPRSHQSGTFCNFENKMLIYKLNTFVKSIVSNE